MGFRTVIFALNLLNLLLLFRFLLGCEFRRTRGSVIMGALIATGVFVLSMPWLDDFLLPYPDFSVLLYALLPTICLKGRKVNLFCMGVAYFCITAPLDDLARGMMMVILQGKTDFDDFVWCVILAQVATTAIFLVLIYCTKKYRNTLNTVANGISPLVYVFYIIGMYLFRWDYKYIGGNDLDIQMLSQGANAVKDSITSIIFTILVIAFISIFYQRKRLRQEIRLKEKCIEEQAEQYDFMGRANQESRKFRHDFNRHMDMLADLFACGRTEELGAYIRQLSDIKERAYYISTGNMVCDAIVNQYYVKCRDAGITLKCSGAFPDGLSVEMTDLCVLMSNGLENAYEAAASCSGNREIQCKIGNRKHLVFITILNPAARPPVIEAGSIQTTKADTGNHGFGTKNMQEAALRNGGSVRWRYDAKNGIVETRIYLKDTENVKNNKF